MSPSADGTQLRYAAPMTPRWRRVGLTAHIASSVGWLGAVAAFLVLSIAGLTSREEGTVRGAYLAMNLIGEFLVVPLSVVALATGLIQALGTEWGLFRYYWVLVKFALTIGATSLLLLHQFTAVENAAMRVIATAPGTFPEIGSLGTQLVGDAGLALLMLVAITVLSVYKPWGRFRHGLPRGLKVFLAVVGVIVVGFALMHHLHGGGHRHHGH